MVIVAGRLQQFRVRMPPFRRSLSATQGCAFEMRRHGADSTGCPVVVESEAFSAFTAQDLRVSDRATTRALIDIG